MRLRTSAAPLLGVLAALSGCVATQQDMLQLESETGELRHQIGDLKKTITNLQANQADLSVSMKQLRGEISAFGEAAQTLQGSLDRLASKMDDLASGISSVGSSVSNKVSALGENLAKDSARKDAELKAALETPASSPTELFHTAEVRLARKDYALAAKGFEDYLSRHPSGALADIATYNLADAYYGQKRWEAAGRQFALVLERYPKSSMIPSARLLYALCLINLKRDLPEARQYLESISADFPRSPEAKAASEQLRQLPKEARAKPRR